MMMDPVKDVTEVSKEEKERILSEKIESMRRKNEELRKRHEEIEADKKLADKHSASVQMEDVKPYIMKPPRPKPEKVIPVSNDENEPNPSANEAMSPRQRLNQKDGPPPDPSYRFLADPDRDATDDKEKKSREETDSEDSQRKHDRRGRGGRGRPGRGRGMTERGRGRGGRGRSQYFEEGGPRGGRRGRGSERAYDQWKAERDAIDEARILRARSGDGEWKREWDNAKIDQENVVAPEIEYDSAFSHRKRGDSFKLKDLLPEDLKSKLDCAENKGDQTRGGRPNRRARLKRVEHGDRDQQHRQRTNWREKNEDASETEYFQNRQEKFKVTTTESGEKVLVRTDPSHPNQTESVSA